MLFQKGTNLSSTDMATLGSLTSDKEFAAQHIIKMLPTDLLVLMHLLLQHTEACSI